MPNVKEEPMDGTSSQTSQPTPPAYAQPAPSAAAGYAPLGNKPFTIAFDGTVLSGTMAIRSVRDIERLMKVLQSQKGAFEAMQEADTDDRDG